MRVYFSNEFLLKRNLIEALHTVIILFLVWMCFGVRQDTVLWSGVRVFICTVSFVSWFFLSWLNTLSFHFDIHCFAGNDNLHKLTTLGTTELYVRLEAFSGDWYYAKYGDFKVADESDGYRLSLKAGSYEGNAGRLFLL